MMKMFGFGGNTKEPDENPIVLPHEAKDRWAKIEKQLKKKVKTVAELSTMMTEMHNGRKTFGNMALKRVLDGDPEEAKRFFSETLPFIQSLVLKIPEAFKEQEIRILKIGKPGMQRLSCLQCACLNAAAVFQLLPRGKMCPQLSFTHILQCQPQKVKCILHYFHRRRTSVPDRYVEFYRNVLPKEKGVQLLSAKTLLENKTPLANFEIKGRPHVIEDAQGCMQADFANEWIGGGVLHGGCVQEEILFVEKPECLVSLLFCNVMRDHESITIVGAERFSTHRGYARSFRWAGDFVDEQPVDSKKRLSNVIVAYDALCT